MLVECTVVEEIKCRRQTHSWAQSIGAEHDLDAEAFGKAIYGGLQLALPSKGPEKVKLHYIVDVDEFVGDETDQSEWTGVIDLVQKIDTD